MNAKYVGSRPVKLRKSNWQKRELAVQRKEQKKDRKKIRELEAIKQEFTSNHSSSKAEAEEQLNDDDS
jgi:hypothetical protein